MKSWPPQRLTPLRGATWLCEQGCRVDCTARPFVPHSCKAGHLLEPWPVHHVATALGQVQFSFGQMCSECNERLLVNISERELYCLWRAPPTWEIWDVCSLDSSRNGLPGLEELPIPFLGSQRKQVKPTTTEVFVVTVAVIQRPTFYDRQQPKSQCQWLESQL